MRVAVISHGHPDFSRGGGEVSAFRHFLALRETYDCTFVAAGPRLDSASGKLFSLSPILELRPQEFIYSPYGYDDANQCWSSDNEFSLLLSFLRALNADVYHFHHYWRVGLDVILGLSRTSTGSMIAITLHEMLAICLHHGQMVRVGDRALCNRAELLDCAQCFPEKTLSSIRTRELLHRSVLNVAEAHVYPSKFIRDRYVSWGLDASKAHVLENYIGLPTAIRQDCEENICRNFAFFGQPTGFKGLDVLCEGFALALKERNDISLRIFGCEAHELAVQFPQIEDYIKFAGSRIKCMGRYRPDDVIGLMSSAGWIVIPSVWWENSPVVVQEARAAGVPMIVSDIGGLSEKANSETGALQFKVGSASDLARTIVRAAGDPMLRMMCIEKLSFPIAKEEFLRQMLRIYSRENPSVRVRRKGAVGLADREKKDA